MDDAVDKAGAIMKIGFFTDDFIKISDHPGRSAGLFMFEITGSSIVNKERRIFNDTDFSKAPHFNNFGRCGRNGNSGHGCFRFKKGFIEINENIKNLNIGDPFLGCKIIFCRAIGYNLERKLAGAQIEIFVTEEIDIQSALKLFLKGALKNLHNCNIA